MREPDLCLNDDCYGEACICSTCYDALSADLAACRSKSKRDDAFIISQAVEWEATKIDLAACRETLKDATHMCWLIIKAAGGEVRIPSSLLLQFDEKKAALARYEMPDTGEVVFRAIDAARAAGSADEGVKP